MVKENVLYVNLSKSSSMMNAVGNTEYNSYTAVTEKSIEKNTFISLDALKDLGIELTSDQKTKLGIN